MHRVPFRIDRIQHAAERRCQQVADKDAADRPRRGAGADDRNRCGLEEWIERVLEGQA
jgi:hypothetical protein